MTRRDDAIRTALLTGVRPAVDASFVHTANLCDSGVPTALLNQGCDGAGHCDKLRQSQLDVNPPVSKIARDVECGLRNLVTMEPAAFTPDWFLLNFKRTNKKAADLVRFLQSKNINIDSPKLSKSINGTRNLTTEEQVHIAAFFGYDPAEVYQSLYRDEIMSIDDGFDLKSNLHALSRLDPSIDVNKTLERWASPKQPLPNAGLPDVPALTPGMLPILGLSVGGDNRTRTLFNGQRLGEVTRPTSLANNPRAYATYVHGESMEPRYEAGEIVLVNPDKGYRKGNYVVAQVYDNEGDPPFGYVKRFISFGDELVLEQLNPPDGEDRIMRFPRDRVVAVHRIVGTLDE